MEQEFFETKELDQRRADSLTVTLWWVKNTMSTFVTVLDTRVNPPVEHMIEVPDGIAPQSVYLHPMAYITEAA